MKYWDGTTWNSVRPGFHGQGLSFCNGVPTWTTGGECPAKIGSLACGNANHNGTLTDSIYVNFLSGVSSAIPYQDGNGGIYNEVRVSSTGVTGLEAYTASGRVLQGQGYVTFLIQGTPSSSGIASFEINFGGRTCTLTRNVEVDPISIANFSSIGTPEATFEGEIYDIDGNAYKMIKIGNQTWIAENLKTSKYNDGSKISYLSDNSELNWQNDSYAAFFYYNNDSTYNLKYGKLYNWYAVSPTTNNNKNICPTGWHVPSSAEWNVLTDYLGGDAVAGGKMKEVGLTSWNTINKGATNVSLFTAKPAGLRNSNVAFTLLGLSAEWWSITEENTNKAFYIDIFNSSESVTKFSSNKYNARSVRCLKD
jgi:uncharacterized protein (TIGR02145 family)